MPDPNDSEETGRARADARPPDATDPAAAQLQARLREAMALHRGGLLDEAGRIYEEILRVNPTHFDAMHLLGVLAAQSNDHPRAAELIGQAIAIDPGHAVAHRNLGLALKELGNVQEALQCHERAIALKPGYAEAWNNRGNALRELGDPVRAIESYDHALRIRPGYAEAFYNRGIAQLDIRRPADALASFDRAVALNPSHPEAWNNRGKALKELTQFDAALASYRRAIATRPDHAKAHWNAALVLLLTGRFEEGWRLYEWGWAARERGEPRDCPQPLWLGEQSLDGKRILLHAEQGFGDSIQFCRYAALVARRGAQVMLEVPAPLVTLMRELDGPSVVVCAGDTLPAFDYRCPLLSLPLAFRTTLETIPARIPYLRSDTTKVEAWAARLGARVKPRVGIVWSSVSTLPEDAKRSIALSSFVRGLPAAHCDWICLQKVVKEPDRPLLASRAEIRFFGDELHDFSDTAALIECLDLVVSVDTAVAHLAGALGKRVWILLPQVPDYRWLLDRDDSPWYPTARLYRQERMDDWDGVLQRLKVDLSALAAEERAAPYRPT